MGSAGADLGFLGRGAHLKKLRRAEGGAKIFGVFRVKNHDFTPKNHIFSNCGGRRENVWGISCEKSRFYAKKHIFSNFRRGARRVRPLDPPLLCYKGVSYYNQCRLNACTRWAVAQDPTSIEAL